jgi:hypothetical protein
MSGSPPRPRAEADVPLKMISVTSALLRYGIGRTKFYELVAEGHIKTVKLGAKTLVDLAASDAFFDGLPCGVRKGTGST